MKLHEFLNLINDNEVNMEEEIYFASDEEANTIFSKVELIQFTGENGKYITFVPASEPIDSLSL